MRLAMHTADNKGWQSPRVTADQVQWPIELGLVFPGEVHVKQLQLLAHEYKVPATSST